MAVRIPVVISQHERRNGSVADYEEKLITRLIFENGLDTTLIADLKSIQLDTTDHLCVEGLKGDFALASWETSDYVCVHLHRLGIPDIEIVPVDGSPKHRSVGNGVLPLPTSPPKKIFFVSLSTTMPIDETIQTLRDLREARSIPVFSIEVSTRRNQVGNAGADAARSVGKSQSHPELIPVSKRELGPTSPPLPASTAIATPSFFEKATDSEDEFPNIDQLMIDLDKFEM